MKLLECRQKTKGKQNNNQTNKNTKNPTKSPQTYKTNKQSTKENQPTNQKNTTRKRKIPVNITLQNNESTSHLQTSQKHFHGAPASNLASVHSARVLEFNEKIYT